MIYRPTHLNIKGMNNLGHANVVKGDPNAVLWWLTNLFGQQILYLVSKVS